MAHKTKSCKYCKKRYPVSDGVQQPAGFFCDYDHAIKWANDKAEKARLLAQAQDLKARKEKLKTRGDWLKELQTIFNRFIRLRDQGQPCISCQKVDNGSHQRHASHYRSVGANPELRFCELNVWASCAQCNGMQSGNLINYRIALVNKLGNGKVEWLEGPHKPLKLTIDDIKLMKVVYKNKIKKYQE